MKTTHRDYSETDGDFHRLCRFSAEHGAALRTYSTWSLGRLVDWRYGLYDNKRAVAGFCDRNAHLWFDAFGALVGVAISEEGDGGFAILTTAGHRFLFEEMLDWALATWGGREPHPSIEITAHQTMEARVLARHGFCHTSTFGSWRFDLTRELAPRAPLPEGFTIVDMATHPDYPEQRRMRAEAFGGRSALTEEELAHQLEFYNHSQQGPIYHAPTDLCVMAPDGRLVAGCEALIDAANLEADIERVCTHSAYRRRGLARAVIQECLYRLQEMGLRNAYIGGYSDAAMALYGSLGAVEHTDCFIYDRDGS